MAAAPRKRWTPEQLLELGDFIRTLFERSPFRTWEEWAKAAGVHPTSLSAWQMGHYPPDGYNLFRLIRATELLSGEEAAPPDALDDRLAALEAQVGGLARADVVQAGFETLRQAIDNEATKRTRPVAPRRKRAMG